MEMRTLNAPDARLGQGRVCLGEEGEAASVPSALPRREPFQIALMDSSERGEASGVRSQYMAGARRGPRRATGRESRNARPHRDHDVNVPGRPQCRLHILRSGVRGTQEQTNVT